jgi:hypothetical protein
VPVIIDQLDVRVEPPPSEPEAAPTRATAPAGAVPPAVDLAEVLRLVDERSRRTAAD